MKKQRTNKRKQFSKEMKRESKDILMLRFRAVD